MEATATPTLGQSSSGASAGQAGQAVAEAELCRAGLASPGPRPGSRRLPAAHHRCDRDHRAAVVDAGTRDGFSLNPSNKDAGRSADGGSASDASRGTSLDGGACPGANLQTDPRTAERAETSARFPHAQAACVAGLCGVGTCNPGYVDLDGKPENGCECLESNGGVEICDGVDNNCNGLIDEGFDLQNDAANCGKCGSVCSFAHASWTLPEGAVRVHLPAWLLRCRRQT